MSDVNEAGCCVARFAIATAGLFTVKVRWHYLIMPVLVVSQRHHIPNGIVMVHLPRLCMQVFICGIQVSASALAQASPQRYGANVSFKTLSNRGKNKPVQLPMTLC